MVNKDAVTVDPWTTHRQSLPPVSWDHENTRFAVSLAGFTMKKSTNPVEKIEVTYKPRVLFVHYIRKVGDAAQAPGLVSPIPSVAFVDLEPGQEYEVTTRLMDVDTLQPLPGADPTIHIIKGPDASK